MHAATGGPNVKWGGTGFKWGGRAPLTPPLATDLHVRDTRLKQKLRPVKLASSKLDI